MLVRRSLRHLIGFRAYGRNRQDGALPSLASHCSVVLIRVRPILCLIRQHLYGALSEVRRRNYRVLVTRSSVPPIKITEFLDKIVRQPLCCHPERFE